VAVTALLAKLITETLPAFCDATNSSVPSGVIAMPFGPAGTVMDATMDPLEGLTTETLLPEMFET
jgi:hypothetical protein